MVITDDSHFGLFQRTVLRTRVCAGLLSGLLWDCRWPHLWHASIGRL